MERNYSEILKANLERYQEIISYYNQNPSRVDTNRKQLDEIQNTIYNLTSSNLHRRLREEEWADLEELLSINSLNLSRLLLQN